MGTLYCNFLSCSDQYEVTRGLCRNENGEYDDIFASDGTTPTLKECKKKCDNLLGCGAVSYHELTAKCHGTSNKSTTVSESKWKCYYKTGNKLYKHSIVENFFLLVSV